ncbi:MAG: protein translocase subunit SecD [Nitrospira sp.]|nr:protein translocase subunit SecD [bacterium]MBL7048799.1 protein translocase subunit SecD [Nitrospira sp.]
MRDSLPEWLQEYGIVLGLDLQGGIHLVYEVDGDKAVEVTVERIASRLINIFKDEKVPGVLVSQEGLNITITPNTEEIYEIVSKQYGNLKIVSRLDESITYTISASEIENIKDQSVDQALETIRNRVDAFGVAEPTIHRQANNEIVIQLPGVKDTERAIELVGTAAILEFKILDSESPIAAQLPVRITASQEAGVLAEFAEKIPADDEILFGRVKSEEVVEDLGNEYRSVYLVKKRAPLTGAFLSEARVEIDNRSSTPAVAISFDSEGSKIFEEVTTNNVNKRLAIVLDENVYSAPNINEPISGGSATISGDFTMEEARDLAIVLRSGSLPAPLKMLQNITVGPSLGKDSIAAGINAGLIGALLVVVFMVIYYKMSGVIANFALVLNIVVLMGILSAFNATLTLPGIAGVILAIGMAVDSNVLMFERIREEMRIGKTPRAAIDSGYDKAFWTIFDSHVTTLITAIVLFQFGTGPIKGFAVTLGVGVFINLFTALIGTKTIFDLITTKYEVKKLSI